ncbi:MAG: PQQ-binding-like beta-propeller repeat protein [Candidatus Dormibacter sp.]
MAANPLRRRPAFRVVRGLVLAAGTLAFLASAAPASAADTAWPKYLHDDGGSGFAPGGGITAVIAPHLKPVSGWPVELGATISTQPVLANGLVYVGAWNGNEYALRPSGAIAWTRFLGITTKGKACQYPIGVAGTSVVADVMVGGKDRSVLFVGGGGNADAAGKTFAGGTASLFALDALTGGVLWRTALGASPDHFIWSSPAFYHGSVYLGVSAFADCPLIQGQLVQLDAASGRIQHTFNVVAGSCVGGSLWGSPTIDETEGAVYVASGNGTPCSVFGSAVGSALRPKRAAATGGLLLLGLLLAGFAWPRPSIRALFWAGVGLAVLGVAGTSLLVVGPHVVESQPYTEAVVKLSATDLHVIGHWQVPQAEAVVDSDFGSTPTLFSGTVTGGGARRRLVGVANKNGTYYVFDRAGLDRGPVARLRIADGGNPPTSGNGSISPSAFDGARLYVGGGHLAVNGQLVAGTLSAFDPDHLQAPIWRTGLSGPVLGAVSAIPGAAVVAAGSSVVMVDSSGGGILWQASAVRGTAAYPAMFYGAASVAYGRLYLGDTAGHLYAYEAP